MKSKVVAVMGYPDKGNQQRLNTNRTSSTGSKSNNKKEKRRQ